MSKVIPVYKREQLQELAEVGRGFYPLLGYSTGEWDADHWANTWMSLIDMGIAHVFALKEEDKLVGTIGLIFSRSAEDNVLCANEAFWYVQPESRGKGLQLLAEAEAWAKMNGVKRFTMVHLKDSMPDKLRRLYGRMGYKEIETHYMKEF